MTNSRDPSDEMPPAVSEPQDSQTLRKPYRAPDCRKLGDMKQVTLKTGPNADGSNPNPTRP